MSRILVVEDDGETAKEIIAELESTGFDVDCEATGSGGLARAETGAYDVITVDRMLPGLDGLTLVETIRRQGITTPVLVLSALGDVDERVRGLRAGGDDYLTKPFALLELRARVEALMRRSPEPRQTTLRVSNLELDLLARTVKRGCRSINLAPRELLLLEFLMRNAGQVVTRAMLFDMCAPGDGRRRTRPQSTAFSGRCVQASSASPPRTRIGSGLCPRQGPGIPLN